MEIENGDILVFRISHINPSKNRDAPFSLRAVNTGARVQLDSNLPV